MLVGLGAALTALATQFTLVKIVGAVYLIYLGIATVRQQKELVAALRSDASIGGPIISTPHRATQVSGASAAAGRRRTRSVGRRRVEMRHPFTIEFADNRCDPSCHRQQQRLT
ncbi:hypothetical protein [Nocardia sp. Marseille-Q1738]